MSTKAERSEAAAMLGKAGKGEAKRRGDAAHYAAIRLKREGTVTIEDMRAVSGHIRAAVEGDYGKRHDQAIRVADWLEREADRRERVNQERAKERKG